MTTVLGSLSRWALAVVVCALCACGGTSGQPGHTFEVFEEDGVPVAVSSGVVKLRL